MYIITINKGNLGSWPSKIFKGTHLSTNILTSWGGIEDPLFPSKYPYILLIIPKH